MTGRPTMRRPASATLLRYEEIHDAIRAEYRRRERQAPGSGDTWLTSRITLLETAAAGDAEAVGSHTAHTPLTSHRGVVRDSKDGDGRAPARRRARGRLSRLVGGGAVSN